MHTPSLLKFCEETVERKIYPILWIIMYNHVMFVCVLLIFHLKLLYYLGWLLCNNCKSLQRPFNERWKMLEKEVIEPRNLERQHIYQSRNPYYRYDLEPFRVCFEGQRQLAITNLFPQLGLVIDLLEKLFRWGGRIFGCSLLSPNFWRNSFQGFHMKQMVSFFRCLTIYAQQCRNDSW